MLSCSKFFAETTHFQYLNPLSKCMLHNDKVLPACNLSLHLLADVLILFFVVSPASAHVFAGLVVTLDAVISLLKVPLN